MTDCQTWLDDLTHTADRILAEDLAALRRMPERSRIERYNEIKANEEELRWEFLEECPEFLTSGEVDHFRSSLRLARLLIAASFYADDDVPPPMQDDFIDAELEAVVEFDRYKQFDALDKEQIERRIRRMDGEVYELVQEYTSTQIANIDALIDHPDVQQDVIERLVDRYEDRRDRIREGFFLYVETHGLEHMVEEIEEAIGAVADATEKREQIQAAVQEELADLETTLEQQVGQQQREFNAALDRIERQLAQPSVDTAALREALEEVDTSGTGGVDQLDISITQIEELMRTLEAKIDELESARQEALEAEHEPVAEATANVVTDELERLQEQRSELQAEIDRLRQEREEIAHARDRFEDRQDDLETRLEDIETAVDTTGGIEGKNVVTAETARLFEMDYIGRFDTTMHELETLQLPAEVVDITSQYWDGHNEHRNEAGRMQNLLEEADGGTLETHPINVTARYEVTEQRYLGLSRHPRMIIEASVHSHLEAHARHGFDAEPAHLDDLLHIVNRVVREAHETEVPYLLGVASPTGWTSEVKQHVVEDELARTRYSRHVSVCLVDLQSGEVIYDSSDPIVTENISIFQRAVQAETVEDCVAWITSEYINQVGRDTVLLEEVAQNTDFDRHIISQAFSQLEGNGVGEQFYIDDQGLALETHP